eukprot:2171517-Amphidinium_carterae.1
MLRLCSKSSTPSASGCGSWRQETVHTTTLLDWRPSYTTIWLQVGNEWNPSFHCTLVSPRMGQVPLQG